MIISKDALVALVFFLAAAVALLSITLIGFSAGTSIAVTELVDQVDRIEAVCMSVRDGV